MSDIDLMPLTETILNSDDEADSEDNLFLVENLVSKKPVFIYSKSDGILREKDALTAIKIQCFDLSILKNIELSDDNTIMKLIFDSKVKNKSQIMYKFSDSQEYINFKDNILKPWLAKRQMLSKNQAEYECLKCGKKRISKVHLVNCPSCGSDAIFELYDESSTS